MKANFAYLRGLEGLNVSKNYEQAKQMFDEAMKFRPFNVSWLSKCLSQISRCEIALNNTARAKYIASKAIKFAKIDGKIDPLLVSIEANIDKAPKVENLLLELHHSYMKPYSIVLSKFFSQSEDELERASNLIKTSLLTPDIQIQLRKVLAHMS